MLLGYLLVSAVLVFGGYIFLFGMNVFLVNTGAHMCQ
jgi:hypothetical protein